MLHAPQHRAGIPSVLSGRRPQAYARVSGSQQHPKLQGIVRFYQLSSGVAVTADIAGLPVATETCPGGFHGFHIHEGGRCTGTEAMPFADAKGHYNPKGCPHPGHAGDLPPLLATQSGRAWSAFLTDRLTLADIIGKTVIIHSGPDDFTSQPSGNSGAMIACGAIRRAR